MSAHVHNLYKDSGHCTVMHEYRVQSNKNNNNKKTHGAKNNQFSFEQLRLERTENEGVMRESKRQSRRYVSGGNKDSER